MGPAKALYEKKVHVSVASDRTLSRRPILQAFFLCAAVWLPLLAGGGSVRAQAATPRDPTWAVEILPTSRCADDAALLDRLNGQIPEAQRAPLGSAELRAQVMIGRDQVASVMVVDQLTQREAGQRQLTVPKGGCEAAADALALVMSVMMEAGRSLLPPPAEPAPAPPPPPPPPPLPEPPQEDDEPPARPRQVVPKRHAWLGPPPGHDLHGVAGTGYGLLPGWSLGGSAAWGIRWSRFWPIWLAGSGWLSERTSDARGRLGAAYGSISTCPFVLEKSRVRGELCPGIAIGAIWAEGRKVAQSERTVSPLAMISLGLHARVKLVGPLELVGVVRGEVPVVRLTFVYYREDGRAPEIHETRPVVLSIFGGLGLRFR